MDAGNGTGGVIAVPLFESLGIEVVPLFIEMDGRFPNHHPDPTVEKNLEHLKAKVKETGADLGIAYDGDADRVGAVDETGTRALGRPNHDPLLPRGPRRAPRRGNRRRGEVLLHALRRHREARRAANHVEGGPQPHQGEDEGGAGAARRRDERPHLLRAPLVRLRRRHLLVGAAARAALPHRRAALLAPRRRASDRVHAGAAGRLPGGEEVRGGEARPGVLRGALRGRHGGRRPRRLPGRLGARPGVEHAAAPRAPLRGDDPGAARRNPAARAGQGRRASCETWGREVPPLALGVDLGGTNARAAVVDTDTGEIVAAHKEPLRDRAPARVVEVVRHALRRGGRRGAARPRHRGGDRGRRRGAVPGRDRRRPERAEPRLARRRARRAPARRGRRADPDRERPLGRRLGREALRRGEGDRGRRARVRRLGRGRGAHPRRAALRGRAGRRGRVRPREGVPGAARPRRAAAAAGRSAASRRTPPA